MFDTFRDKGWNTYYGTKRYPPAHHVPHVIITYFTVVIATALLIFVLSSRGRERWSALMRLVFNLHTAVVILFCLTGQEWSVAYVHSKSNYSPDMENEVQAKIGLHVGLKSVNITYIADHNTTQEYGQIYYNEEYSFRGATDLEQGLKTALRRGLPYSMLYVLEYFEVDAGGLRWSRILRTAGHFAYILLCAAVVLWTVSQMLIGFVISRGLMLNLASGVCMISAVFIYHGIHPDIPLAIPFPDGFLRLRYGWCFWLVCGSGIFTVLYSIIMLLVYYREPEWTMDLLLSDAALADAENSQNADEGVLQIMTPYNERKYKVERQKSYFVNEGFSEDDSKADFDKGACADKCPPDSDSDALIELEYRGAVSAEIIKQPLTADTKQPRHTYLRRMDTKHGIEIPPDYSSTEDDCDTRRPSVPSTVIEIGQDGGTRSPDAGQSRLRASAIQSVAL